VTPELKEFKVCKVKLVPQGLQETQEQLEPLVLKESKVYKVRPEPKATKATREIQAQPELRVQ
jgi:hypothetical protein